MNQDELIKYIVEFAGIILTIVGSIWASYASLRDKISELKTESHVTKAIIQTMQEDVKMLKRDVHNLALKIGTQRAIAESNGK